MKPTGLGHERVESPLVHRLAACARVESSNRERAGRREIAACRPGILSGIVVGDRESRPHREGPDGSTQLGKETRAGHAGSDQHEPTSLRGLSNWTMKRATVTVRLISWCNRGTGCGKTARPGLWRGLRVTGVPTPGPFPRSPNRAPRLFASVLLVCVVQTPATAGGTQSCYDLVETCKENCDSDAANQQEPYRMAQCQYSLIRQGQSRSVRVGAKYRALGVSVADGIQWFRLGTHAEYDKLMG